jgi:hypothetical protein
MAASPLVSVPLLILVSAAIVFESSVPAESAAQQHPGPSGTTFVERRVERERLRFLFEWVDCDGGVYAGEDCVLHKRVQLSSNFCLQRGGSGLLDVQEAYVRWQWSVSGGGYNFVKRT